MVLLSISGVVVFFCVVAVGCFAWGFNVGCGYREKNPVNKK